MKHKELKQKITEAVVAELPQKPELEIDKLLDEWFMSPNQDSLRLTTAGNQAFVSAEIEFFDFDLDLKFGDPKGWYGILLEMSKKIKCPYYLGSEVTERKKPKNKSAIKIGRRKPFIRVYDSKVAMMVGLYGNLKDYLESVKIKTRKY
jgi:hypothetical protein